MVWYGMVWYGMVRYGMVYVSARFAHRQVCSTVTAGEGGVVA